MTRPLVVLRPEPGNARTARMIESLGHRAIRLPLFAVVPVAWTPPPGCFDALMLTSANAIRHAGPLGELHALPVVAVGESTAAAARAADLDVVLTGDGDATALAAAARARGFASLLHLAGRDRAPTAPHVTTVTVYVSDPLPIDPAALRSCEEAVVLLHSVRAAHRFAALVDDAKADRARIALAGLSEAVVRAAGEGWGAAVAAPAPNDAALAAVAVAAVDRPLAR